MSEDDMLALNKVTGLVHDYKGTVPGGLGSESHDVPIGIVPCGCDNNLFKEAVEDDNLMMIERKHLEEGIWEPAECLQNE